MSTLYLVGTPIGNLEDMTYRGVETLKSVDVIASEDTRHTRILLSHYDIKKPLISYYKQKEVEGTEEIIRLLDQGKAVALVTDAGMPAVSDPGAVLVRTLREKGYAVTVVPGPTAVTSAVALSGLKSNGFLFLGFLPEKNKDRDRLLIDATKSNQPIVIYVAPHDVQETLGYLYDKLGSRKVHVIKEITKVHETVYSGRLGDIAVDNLRGEFVFVIDVEDEDTVVDMTALIEEVTDLIKNGISKKDAVKIVSKEHGVSKNVLYDAVHQG